MAQHPTISKMEIVQTAVEWFAKQVEDNLGWYPVDIIKEANQIFEKQIKEAFDYGDYCIDLPDGGWEQKYKSADQYYTLTYKNDKPMAQQTAVEWLVEKITDSGHLWITNKPSDMIEISKFIEQAKQMEREQHKDTWDAGMSEGIGTTMGSLDYDGEFINYYNETYGK